MGLFTKTKMGGGLTKTRNNKTGKTSYTRSIKESMGKSSSFNFGTGKKTSRTTRKP